MADAIPWYGANKKLQSPQEADYPVIEVFNNGKVSVSCWKFTLQELTDIVQNNGCIFIAVLGGPSQYPMYVGTEPQVREITADFGKVWNRNKSLDDKIPENKK